MSNTEINTWEEDENGNMPQEDTIGHSSSWDVRNDTADDSFDFLDEMDSDDAQFYAEQQSYDEGAATDFEQDSDGVQTTVTVSEELETLADEEKELSTSYTAEATDLESVDSSLETAAVENGEVSSDMVDETLYQEASDEDFPSFEEEENTEVQEESEVAINVTPSSSSSHHGTDDFNLATLTQLVDEIRQESERVAEMKASVARALSLIQEMSESLKS